MTEFCREERYIVIKRKHLNKKTESMIRNVLQLHNIPTVECVVTESDWSIYEDVWALVEAEFNRRDA